MQPNSFIVHLVCNLVLTEEQPDLHLHMDCLAIRHQTALGVEEGVFLGLFPILNQRIYLQMKQRRSRPSQEQD